MSRHGRNCGLVAAGVCVGLLAAACGEDGPPPSDREAVRQVVVEFFDDVVNRDVEAVCGALTGVGRAAAVGHPTVAGRPLPRVTERRCLERRARAPLSSVDLPQAVDHHALRVRTLWVRRRRARVLACAGALCGRQRLLRTGEGWKIDWFELPVRD